MVSMRHICKKLSRSRAEIGGVKKRLEEGNSDWALNQLHYQIRELTALADELEVNITQKNGC